jgi:hypothetical protein
MTSKIKSYLEFLSHLKNFNKWVYATKLCQKRRDLQLEKQLKEIERKKTVAVCMIRNEDLYIKDWLNFHYKNGIDCVFVYDNALLDDNASTTYNLLKSYIDAGLLIYIRWRDIEGLRVGSIQTKSRKKFSIQELCFFHFNKYYSKYFDYYIKIDIDEFLYSKDGSKISSNLSHCGCLPIWGYNYGSSGKESHSDIPVYERFIYRNNKVDHIKSITRSLGSYEWFNAHISYVYPWKIMQCSVYDINNTAESKVFSLNHYKIKSKNEFLKRKIANDKGYQKGEYSVDEFDEIDKELNKVKDEKIMNLAGHNSTKACQR